MSIVRRDLSTARSFSVDPPTRSQATTRAGHRPGRVARGWRPCLRRPRRALAEGDAAVRVGAQQGGGRRGSGIAPGALRVLRRGWGRDLMGRGEARARRARGHPAQRSPALRLSSVRATAWWVGGLVDGVEEVEQEDRLVGGGGEVPVGAPGAPGDQGAAPQQRPCRCRDGRVAATALNPPCGLTPSGSAMRTTVRPCSSAPTVVICPTPVRMHIGTRSVTSRRRVASARAQPSS